MEKPRFFRVTGRVVLAGGGPLAGAHLSLLDQDRVRDDLIAWGATGRDGSFSASFTREAFNQDWLEDDAAPHLYLEVRAPGVRFRRDWQGLVLVDGEGRLGTIEVPPGSTDERVTARASGVGDWVSHRRLRVDDEVTAHVLREVVPRVQALLGGSGLMEGVRVRTARSLPDAFAAAAARVLGAGREVPSWLAPPPASAGPSPGRSFAFYDPHERLLWLDEGAMTQGGLDVMKATVARELVRVWQFQTHPGTLELFDQAVRTLGDLHRYLLRADPDEPMSDELAGRVVEQHSFALVTDGHVQHVDEGWIRPWYPLAEFIGSLPSALDVARWLVRQTPGVGALRSRGRAPAPAAHTSARQRAALAVVSRRLHPSGQEPGQGRAIFDEPRAAQGRAGAGRPAPFAPSLVATTAAALVEAFAARPGPDAPATG